jgi:hypothetical protein
MQGGRTWRSACTAAALIAVSLAAPATVHASHVSCGTAISSDTTLDSDLVGCPGNGIEIVASDVTLDLAGHTISGTQPGLGVVTGPGASRVTVMNGTVRDFQTAIRLGPGSDYVARNVSLHDSHVGLLLAGVNGALVKRISASGITGSAIHAPGSNGVSAVRNHLFANNSGMGGIGFANGRIARNLVEDNAFYGFFFFDATGTVFDRNVIRDNGTFGISLGEGSTGNRIVHNRIIRSGMDGIALFAEAGPNTLERNRSDRNADDGFEIGIAGATLIRNTAFRNGDLGFEAPLGAALALRNMARRNGDPRQCVGIPCR